MTAGDGIGGGGEGVGERRRSVLTEIRRVTKGHCDKKRKKEKEKKKKRMTRGRNVNDEESRCDR